MLASLLFVGFPLLAVTVSQVYYFWFETSVEAYFWGAALLALAAVTSNALIAWHRWRFRHQHNESMLVLPIVCGFFSVGLCSYLFYIAGFISPAPTTYIEHEVPFIETVLAFFFLAQPVDWLVYAKYHRD
jgi:phosphatidylserine synthase